MTGIEIDGHYLSLRSVRAGVGMGIFSKTQLSEAVIALLNYIETHTLQPYTDTVTPHKEAGSDFDDRGE